MSRILLKILLLINGLMEGGFGIFLILFPEKMSRAMGCLELIHESYALVSRMYGLAALCLGILSVSQFMRRAESDSLSDCLWIFTVFHIGMAAIQIIDNPYFPASLSHIILGAAFLFFSIKYRGGR